MAEKAGVVLGFETMETEFMNTVEKAMKYTTLVDSPYLNVYPDIGNITNAAIEYKNDVLEDTMIGKGHLCAMHLKRLCLANSVPFGTGHVNFKGNRSCMAAWNTKICDRVLVCGK